MVGVTMRGVAGAKLWLDPPNCGRADVTEGAGDEGWGATDRTCARWLATEGPWLGGAERIGAAAMAGDEVGAGAKLRGVAGTKFCLGSLRCGRVWVTTEAADAG